MDAEKLHGYILNGICAEESSGEYSLSFPFFFEDGQDEKLTVTWKRIKAVKLSDYAKKLRAEGYTVMRGNEYPCYRMSDGGMILKHLEKRVGDLTEYLPKIKTVMKKTGEFELTAGRMITLDFSAYSKFIPMHYLSSLLELASIIGNLDIFDTPSHFNE